MIAYLVVASLEGDLAHNFLKDGESTVDSCSIFSTTYSATRVLTSQGSNIAEPENVLIRI